MQGIDSMTTDKPGDDHWHVGEVRLASRFLLGTAGYPSTRSISVPSSENSMR